MCKQKKPKSKDSKIKDRKCNKNIKKWIKYEFEKKLKQLK
jgi:hypothetical protein